MSADESILVIDVGSSSVRAARFWSHGRLDEPVVVDTPPHTPADGIVEFDPAVLRDAAMSAATAVLESGPVAGIGIAAQRASTVVWNRRTGRPVGPGIGWQDLRTVGRCLELRAQGLHLAPNTMATKAEWLLDRVDDPDRGNVLAGTIDSWLIWSLTGGERHVSDATNAGLTGLLGPDGWYPPALDALHIDVAMLPEVVDTLGAEGFGPATALPGAPPVLASAGDQQASMVGQGCVSPGRAKITFGTGGVIDLVANSTVSPQAITGAGCYPLVAWQASGVPTPGVEGIMLAAGSHLTWLRDGLGIVADLADVEVLAASVADTDGVWFVPALNGLGTPHWDHGARGTLLGLTRGTTRAHVVRAVLDGIARRGGDLVEAAEAATDSRIDEIGVDGGMTASPTFVKMLADATQRPVAVSAEAEATARGAGQLAAVAAGWFSSIEASAASVRPRAVIDPGTEPDRARWAAALDRSRGWIPELSTLRF